MSNAWAPPALEEGAIARLRTAASEAIAQWKGSRCNGEEAAVDDATDGGKAAAAHEPRLPAAETARAPSASTPSFIESSFSTRVEYEQWRRRALGHPDAGAGKTGGAEVDAAAAAS